MKKSLHLALSLLALYPTVYAIDQTFIENLHNLGVIQQGKFILNDTGTLSDVYFDIRLIISSPRLLKQIADSICIDDIDRICGVPHGATPHAAAIAYAKNIPFIMLRKEVKNHGTGKLIEGHFKKGERVMLIEDVCVTGQSVRSAAQALQNEGLVVTDIVIILDRQEGAVEYLKSFGYNVHVITTRSEVLAYKK